ncbi:MAG: UDP-N-acetylmuramoyl-L-alanyl-D-glutamate--2,6-diaminopimelate ligase [Deltaproteobacteria bacterium]
MSMPLEGLLARISGAELVAGAPETEISLVAIDSRRVADGALFVALPGAEADGLDYISDAVVRGAVALVAAPDAIRRAMVLADGRPVVRAEKPRLFAAAAAAEMAGHPSAELVVVAITGTSGKTTTSYIVESIFAAAGHHTGIIGTIEYRVAGASVPAPLTTPDAVSLQGLFREMCDAGVTHIAIEASSHALEQGRVDATQVDAAIYTNLSRDHLDYHGDEASYAAAKERLFREILPSSRAGSFAVLNADDAYVAGLASELDVPVLTFGDIADVSHRDIEIGRDGIRGTLCFGAESHSFHSHLIGRPHLENLLGAAAATWRLGIAPAVIVAGIEACRGVPGRLESIEEGQDFTVLVDYAHKPDALERTLESLRPLTEGRLIVLFGCGGDRDRGKRKQMGEIAGRLADLIVLTSDNPRTENPESILREIEAGVQAVNGTRVEAAALGKSGVVGQYVVLPERRAAIGVAVASAGAGDVVLIAGKGHEDYQIVGKVKRHLDDREEARRALGDCA